ncbi:MAG: hypothetical protein WC179_07950 [Candidatus Cloacimonadaceae bacterium]
MKDCFSGTRTKPITLKTIETIKLVKDCELSITEEAMRETDPVIGLKFIKQCSISNITIKIKEEGEDDI